jgi:hypothetical protein
VQVAGQSIGIIDASPWFDGSSVIGDLLVVQIPANIDPGAVSLGSPWRAGARFRSTLGSTNMLPCLLFIEAGRRFSGTHPRRADSRGFRRTAPSHSRLVCPVGRPSRATRSRYTVWDWALRILWSPT